MNRPFAVSALFLPLALAACPQGGAPERLDTAQPGTSTAEPPAPADPALAATASCTNSDAGYRIEYPAEWHTNAGDVMPAYSLFDPEPIRIEPHTELPFDIAVAIRRENITFERVTTAQPARRELMRAETRVGGRMAVRMETELRRISSALRAPAHTATTST